MQRAFGLTISRIGQFMCKRLFFFLLTIWAIPNRMLAQQAPPEIPVRLVVEEVVEKGQMEKKLIRELGLNGAYFSTKTLGGKAEKGAFQVELNQIPVEGAVAYILDGQHKTIFSLPDIDFQAAPEIISSEAGSFKNPVWLQINGKWEIFDKIEKNEAWPRLVSITQYYDAQGQLRFQQDGLYHFSSAPDSLVKGAVFRPDPCSKLQMPYGGDLKDRADSNSVFLTQALDTVFFRVSFENDSFQLKNSRFRMGEFSPPQTPKINQTENTLLFTRDNPKFEEVNVFFHLNQFRKFIDSLGFTQLANYPLKVDAHGMDGMDQSAYSPVLDILAYGDGNVDDGEDASVVVHEYGHVLCHSAQPFGNSGMERKTAEEGICDYLAGSYTKTSSDWQWQRLFKWDGWNEFWPGRELLSSKVYPDQMVGQIHQDGEIFSSALMHLEQEIGRAKTHQILLRSLSLLVPTLSMRQVAFMILESDSMLFGGVHTPEIINAFDQRGLSPYNIIVSNPQSHFEKRYPALQCKRLPQDGWEICWNGSGAGQLRILDASGRLVQQVSVHCGSQYISHLKPGFYLLELETKDGLIRQPCLVGW